MSETPHERRVDKVVEYIIGWDVSYALENLDTFKAELLQQFEAHWNEARREQASEVEKLRARVAKLGAALTTVSEADCCGCSVYGRIADEALEADAK